jgi:hypothetical protein
MAKNGVLNEQLLLAPPLPRAGTALGRDPIQIRPDLLCGQALQTFLRRQAIPTFLRVATARALPNPPAGAL